MLSFFILLHAAWAHGQSSFGAQLAAAAMKLTQQQVIYDPSYLRLAYPMGDVAPNRGVCTDVVIRAYRAMGIDLQQLVHENMKAHFSLYPRQYGLKQPDKNIDHRRVPNLMVFFARKGQSLPISSLADDYLPGDLVCWRLPGNLTHIGIVSPKRSAKAVPTIVHNIGAGQMEEDMLFDFAIIGHYRFAPAP